jgi:hypothetical protein
MDKAEGPDAMRWGKRSCPLRWVRGSRSLRDDILVKTLSLCPTVIELLRKLTKREDMGRGRGNWSNQVFMGWHREKLNDVYGKLLENLIRNGK